MRAAQAQIGDVLGVGPTDGGGARLLWSCVRDARPGARTADGEVHESVRALLATLSDAAQPTELAA